MLFCSSSFQRAPLALLLASFLPIAACAGDDDELGGNDIEAITGSDGGLRVAIRSSALDSRWFLSAFLAQYFPGDVNQGAASSLGTRVVSLQQDGDRLLVLDADDRTAASDVFDPDLLVDAFPVLEDRQFDTPSGSERYVVIDPAAGFRHFQLIRTSLDDSQLVKLAIDLAFSQAFHRTADGGAAWQTVFSGHADAPINPVPTEADPYPLESDPFRASGTLGVALRPYREGEHYQQVPIRPFGADPDHEFYFQSPRRLVPGTTELAQDAEHWDIYPGMPPIEWVISPELAALDATPEYANVDLVGAVQRGVESWNEVFGFPVFTARVAEPGEDFWQDDKNYIIFDPVNAEGRAAVADLRVNPNTGEIRGASVYFGANWLSFSEPGGDAVVGAPPRPPTPVVHLGWEGMPSQPLCVQRPSLRRLAPGAPAAMTDAEKLERYLGYVITHEIGHTLGLRHNFKGSLVPPSSSVMDYTTPQDMIEMGPHPASYDVAAIRYLYGLSPEPPTQPFCTDERADIDPLCRQRDASADPLHLFHPADYAAAIALFSAVLGELDESTLKFLLDQTAGGLVAFIRNGSSEEAAFAWQTAIDELGAPLDPGDATTEHVVVSNLVMAWLLDAVADQHPAAIEAAIIEQATRIIRDVDGVRSRATRASAIAALRKMQSHAGYMALLAAREALATSLRGGSLSPDKVLDVQDLLERIDRATSPYFD